MTISWRWEPNWTFWIWGTDWYPLRTVLGTIEKTNCNISRSALTPWIGWIYSLTNEPCEDTNSYTLTWPFLNTYKSLFDLEKKLVTSQLKIKTFFLTFLTTRFLEDPTWNPSWSFQPSWLRNHLDNLSLLLFNLKESVLENIQTNVPARVRPT